MGTMAISSIDKIMINHFIDLEATGIYSIAFLFGTIVTLPSRPLNKIASTIVAEAWKRDDRDAIKTIYSKSSLNQFIFGGGIFLLLWLNVDIVLLVIGEKYEAGRWVILFMSLAGVIQMATGLNGIIIISSKYYRYQSLFVFILFSIVVISNIIFIPLWGITGAAFSSLVSTILFNLARILFLYKKFRMQPFNYRFLFVILFLSVTLVVGYLLQGIENWALRTGAIFAGIVILYLLPVLVFRISAEINQSITTFFRSFL
jgi:O-antigen/teichoic acid export membrane protein